MNWTAIDFDWNQVRAFLATVEEGSLSAAARALRLTQPTLGRQVTALEAHLGVTLFERAGRRLVLTAAGHDLVEHVRAMGAAATRLSLAASGQAQAATGLVRVTASEMYSAYLLPPLVTELHAAHPGIRVEVVATNDLADLRRREADIALRNARPEDPDLIARKLGTDRGGLFAARTLAARLGPVAMPEDLGEAPFIGLADNVRYLAALNALGLTVGEGNLTALTDNHLVHWALARAGLGIGVAPLSVGRAEADMVQLLPALGPLEFPVWMVAPQELRTSRRVRLVWDHLAARISSSLGRPNPLDGGSAPA